MATGLGTNSIAYSSNGTTWTGLGTSIFSSLGNGVAWNKALGSVNITAPGYISLSEYYDLNNTLDVVSDRYYNTGFSNCAITIG